MCGPRSSSPERRDQSVSKVPISATPALHVTPVAGGVVQSIAKSDVPAVLGKFSVPLVSGCTSEPDENRDFASSDEVTGKVGPPLLGPITNVGSDGLPIGPAGCTGV